VIVEGRDITTVVAPDSPARILLTADEAVRIARREAEHTGVNAEALVRRDAADSKVVNFMTAADGVWTLDTTDMTFDEVVAAVVDYITQRTELGASR
jgi:cytidylate kinase